MHKYYLQVNTLITFSCRNVEVQKTPYLCAGLLSQCDFFVVEDVVWSMKKKTKVYFILGVKYGVYSQGREQ